MYQSFNIVGHRLALIAPVERSMGLILFSTSTETQIVPDLYKWYLSMFEYCQCLAITLCIFCYDNKNEIVITAKSSEKQLY